MTNKERAEGVCPMSHANGKPCGRCIKILGALRAAQEEMRERCAMAASEKAIDLCVTKEGFLDHNDISGLLSEAIRALEVE